MAIIAVLIAKLLDPISFIVALVIVLFSRRWWIIIVAAAVSAVIVETILTSTQFTRTWGQGLLLGFVASTIHASVIFFVRQALTRRSGSAEAPAMASAFTGNESIRPAFDTKAPKVADKQGGIAAVERYLKELGYDVTPEGAAVSALQLTSGYSAAEVASHLALVTLARDVRQAGSDVMSLVKYVPHASAMLDILRQFKDQGLLRETLFQNDGNAILRVVTVDSQQEEWLAKVLSDPVIGNSRVAKSRIRYENL